MEPNGVNTIQLVSYWHRNASTGNRYFRIGQRHIYTKAGCYNGYSIGISSVNMNSGHIYCPLGLATKRFHCI